MEDILQTSSWSVSAWELRDDVERCRGWSTCNGFGDRGAAITRTQYYITRRIIVKVNDIK